MLQITTLFEMIAEGKVAISFFLAYILLTVTSFQDVRHSTDIWNLKTQCAYVGLSLSATRIFPHSSVAARAAFLGKFFFIFCHSQLIKFYFGTFIHKGQKVVSRSRRMYVPEIIMKKKLSSRCLETLKAGIRNPESQYNTE